MSRSKVKVLKQELDKLGAILHKKIIASKVEITWLEKW